MELGKKIRQLRFKARLTQEQLAEKLGIGAQSVSKWENGATMPDITVLPLLAEIFGVTIDDLFDLTVEQRFNRIENRMDMEDDLPQDVFTEYEEFLKEQLHAGAHSQEAVSLLAHLYHHRLETFARKAASYAREAIQVAPEKKDCQWILDKAEGSASWDWNTANHSRTIEFYKQVIAGDHIEPKTPLPYMYLIDNLIADHRVDEAEAYLARYSLLPAHRPFMVPVYKAAIALARFDEKRADEIMEKALKDYPEERDLLFEAAQYYARKCDYERAILYYEASFVADEDAKPRFSDALEGIACIYEIKGDYQKAADTFERISDLLDKEWGITEGDYLKSLQEKRTLLLEKAK